MADFSEREIVHAYIREFRLGGNARRQANAALLLRELGPRAIELVVEELQSDNPEDREYAARCLGAIRCTDECAIEALIEALADLEVGLGRICETASWALGKIGASAIPNLLAASRSPNVQIRGLAIQALGSAAAHDSVLDRLLSDLESAVTLPSVYALSSLENRAAAAIPRLVAILGREQDRFLALQLSILIGRIANAGLTHLTRMVDQDDAVIRETASGELGKLGNEIDIGSERLCDRARDDSSESVRGAAIGSLEQLAAGAIRSIRRAIFTAEHAKANEHSVKVRVRAEIASDNLRRALEPLVVRRYSPVDLTVSFSMEKKKRQPAELEKNLLALLMTCLEWAETTISERKVHGSELLKEHRARLGLGESVSLVSVHNHLQVLARVCGIEKLFETTSKRQSSTLRPDGRQRLQEAKVELERCIEAEERRLAPLKQQGLQEDLDKER